VLLREVKKFDEVKRALLRLKSSWRRIAGEMQEGLHGFLGAQFTALFVGRPAGCRWVVMNEFEGTRKPNPLNYGEDGQSTVADQISRMPRNLHRTAFDFSSWSLQTLCFSFKLLETPWFLAKLHPCKCFKYVLSVRLFPPRLSQIKLH
jgi:hypothetical protein